MPSPGFDLHAALERFAPEVRLHPGDPHRPSSIEWYLERSRLRRWKGWWRRDDDLVPVGELTPQRLGEVADREEDQSHLYVTLPRGAGRRRTRRGFTPEGGQISAPCYVNARTAPDDDAAFDLQYWFFYPFNGRAGRHVTHEGDWEHVTVRVSDEDVPGLVAVYYSAHGLENGRWMRVGRNGGLLQTDRGGPVVYSAMGSHASYPSAGTHRQRGLKPVDRTADGGPVWDTARELVLVQVNGRNPGAGSDTHPWLRYAGRWGAIKRLAWPFASTGPIGPAHQQSWTAEPKLDLDH